MIDLAKDKTKRLLAIHGWSGVILGLLLYVVIVTGAAAVLAHEIGRWSAGGATTHNALRGGVHAHVMEIAEGVDKSFFEEVSIFENSTGNLVAYFHKHLLNDDGQPDDYGLMAEFDPATGEIVLEREGFASDLYGTDPLSALDAFIIDLHVNLHLPHPWGLYATGILGLLMLVAAVSGLIIHRHLLKDIFVPPRYSSALLNKRDRHILAGSWSLPFAFVLAFTGAFYSFAISLGFPVVTKSAFGGDRMAMIEALVGAQTAENDAAAGVANLDAIIARSETRAGSPAIGAFVTNWGRADAVMTVNHPGPEGKLVGFANVYSFSSGEFIKRKPFIGAEPSMANVAYTLMNSLHFGRFAGLVSKLIWVSLGIAMAYVTLTGLHLWIERRSDSRLWRRFAAATTITGYGTNIALAGAAIGFFLSLPGGTTQFWTPAGFIIAALASIAAGCLAPSREARRQILHFGLAAALLLIPVIRAGIHGGFGRGDVDPIVVMMDLALIFGAAWLFGSEYLRLRHRRTTSATAAVPAE